MFFLESAFLGLLVFGERRLSAWGHWWAAFLVFLGSWTSGFFIIVTDAGTIFCILQVFPTGDLHGKYKAKHQPATTAGMEGLFKTEKGAPIVYWRRDHTAIHRSIGERQTISSAHYRTGLGWK